MNTKISEEMIADFNIQMDKIREELMEKHAKFCNDPDGYMIHLMNRMEIARRVFNTFAETGEVKIPD